MLLHNQKIMIIGGKKLEHFHNIRMAERLKTRYLVGNFVSSQFVHHPQFRMNLAFRKKLYHYLKIYIDLVDGKVLFRVTKVLEIGIMNYKFDYIFIFELCRYRFHEENNLLLHIVLPYCCTSIHYV